MTTTTTYRIPGETLDRCAACGLYAFPGHSHDVSFSQGERGAWRRHEADGHVTHVASGTDRTPVHFQYPRGYDSRCGWCYLNATHSEQAHRQEVGA
jgi:hypothetical protein